MLSSAYLRVPLANLCESPPQAVPPNARHLPQAVPPNARHLPQAVPPNAGHLPQTVPEEPQITGASLGR
jgi:hypothetical protein